MATKSLKPQWFPGVLQVVNVARVARSQILGTSGPRSLVPPAPGPLVRFASPQVTFQSSLRANSCASLKSGSRVTSSRKPQVLRRQRQEQGLHGPPPTPPVARGGPGAESGREAPRVGHRGAGGVRGLAGGRYGLCLCRAHRGLLSR